MFSLIKSPFAHAQHMRLWRGFRLLALLCLIGLGLSLSSGALAQSADLRIVKNRDLNFGTFMVFGRGMRTVSPAGLVTDQAIIDLEGERARPAQFTVVYDRGDASNHVIDVTVELAVSAGGAFREKGVGAQLAAFETDVPGYAKISAGEVIRLNIKNCRARRCSISFAVGGRLDVSRQFGGGDIIIPVELDARVVLVNLQ